MFRQASMIIFVAFFSACTEEPEPTNDKVLGSPPIECTRDSDCVGGDVFVGVPTCRKRPAPSLMQDCSECYADDEFPVEMYCVHKVFCALRTSNPVHNLDAGADSSDTEDVGADSSDDAE